MVKLQRLCQWQQQRTPALPQEVENNLTESSSSSEPMSVSQIAAEMGGEAALAGLVTEKAVEFLEMSSKMTTNISSTNIPTETQISSVNEPPGRVKKKTPNGMVSKS